MMVASDTEDYQLLGDVLDQCLKELGYPREDLTGSYSPAISNMSWTSTAGKGKIVATTFTGPLSGRPTRTPGSSSWERS